MQPEKYNKNLSRKFRLYNQREIERKHVGRSIKISQMKTR